MGTLRLRRAGQLLLEIEEGAAVFGREEMNDVVIDDDPTVSRRHARVDSRGGDWYVADLGSSNGVFIDGRLVKDEVLGHGQTLSLGSVDLEVEIEQPKPPPPPEPPPPPVEPTPPPAGADEATRLVPVAQMKTEFIPHEELYAPEEAAGHHRLETTGSARELLAVSEHATPDEIQAAFLDRAQALQAKIAGTQNTQLREEYQASIDELRSATERLSPEAFKVSSDDLPSAQPVVERVKTTYIRADEVLATDRAGAPQPKGVPPPAFSFLVSLLILGLGVAIFFLMDTTKKRREFRERELSQDWVLAQEMAQRLRSTERLVAGDALENGRLSLCNNGTQPIDVAWLGGVRIRLLSREEAGPDTPIYQTDNFNSSYCGAGFELSLEPGSSHEIGISVSDRCEWDGVGVFAGVGGTIGNQTELRYTAVEFSGEEVCLDLADALAPPPPTPEPEDPTANEGAT